jgi:ABC-2 type transport system ATP-binding protein
MTDFAVATENLSKSYIDWRRRRTSALQDVSLKVKPGTIFGLLGRNGAGKTTLVKILLGLVIPDCGHAQILGTNITDYRIRRRVGYLPEQVQLPEHLKAPSFLRYMGELNGIESSVLKQRIPVLLEQLGLSDAKHLLLRAFSKGMQQRLGLAHSLLNDPDLLFLDEPTEGLDPLGRKQVREMLIDLRARGKTVFLNSHLLSEIELVCDQIIIMEKGSVVRSGAPQDFTHGTGVYRLRLARVDAVVRKVAESMFAKATWEDSAVCVTPRDRAHLNMLIDALRAVPVEIDSVEPLRTTLEESFIEVVAGERSS